MRTGFQFDAEISRQVEAIYSNPDAVSQRHAVLQALELRPGERVLDIGSGPGFPAADMAVAVGDLARVWGIDISESMVATSQSRCANLSHVEFQVGNATQLPFPDGDFDVAVSTQVYEYLSDGDLTTALAELHRVLRPGGRALILDTDGDSIVWHSTDRARMARILAAWEEHCADFHLPPKLSTKLARAGFSVHSRDVIPLLNPEYDPNTYSYGLISMITVFTPGKRGVTEEETKAWAENLRRLGEEGSYFFSLNRYLFLAIKSGPTDSTS
jgi:ubiquinone/menaquinone biosynthesis C-methylase UbiE